jgi:hypothetical protein
MGANTETLAESISEIAARSPFEKLGGDSRYVFAADLRMGDGGRRDELSRSGKALFKILGRWYLPRGYTLVLNGDVEDLRNFWIKDILAAWPKMYGLFDAFADDGRLRKIAGDKDLALLKLRSYPYEVLHGLRLDGETGSILATHGHQAAPVADGRERFKAERRLHRAAAALGMPLIEGHTRRPLLESITNRDAVRAELERLLGEGDPSAGESAVDALIDFCRKESRLRSARRGMPASGPGIDAAGTGSPCLFCPGRVVGARGLRFLEIGDGCLRLVRWSRKEVEIDWPASSHRIGAPSAEAPPESIKGTPYRRMAVRSAPIGRVMERASMLAGETASKGGD